MPVSTSTAELRKLSASDLRKEATEKRASIAKKRLGIELGAQKDTAHYQREKKELARILTILNEVEAKEANSVLKEDTKPSTVSTSKKTPKK